MRRRRAWVDFFGDRIDGEEDMEARERMFDKAERNFYARGIDVITPTPHK